jgi:hypothetical protein
MQRACYAIERHQSHWVVSVCGTRVLTCKTKRTALKAARRAMVLLHQSGQAEFPGQRPSGNSNDDFLVAREGLARAHQETTDATRPPQWTRRG